MTIYIDDKPSSLNVSTLTQALTDAQEQLAGTGRCIVQVCLNDQELAGETLHEHLISNAPLGEAEIRLYTADPRELAVQVLGEVIRQLDAAVDAQAAAAEAFQADHTTQGLKLVGEAMAVWVQVQQAVTNSCAMVQLNLDDRIFEGQPVTVHIHALAERIRQLRDLLQQRDTLGLADTLAYEWPETAVGWQRLVGQVILWIQS